METMENISLHQTFILNCFGDLGVLRPVLFVPYSSMLVLALVANALLIYVIVSQKNLHSPMCILIAIMAGVDLIIPFIFIPHMLLSFLLDWRGISAIGCFMQMFLIHWVGTFQATILVWMSLDRYFAICAPLHYHEIMTLTRFMKFVIPLMFRNFFLITLFVVLAAELWFCDGNVINHCFCEHMPVVALACGSNAVNSLVGLSALFLIPVVDFIIIIGFYVIIFSSVLKSGKSLAKALHTCSTHIIVMTLTLAVALVALLSHRVKNKVPSAAQVFLSTMVFLLPCCFNPIIYGIRTTEIRQNILKKLPCCRTAVTVSVS